MDILTRLDACAECEQAPLAPLLADAADEIRMLRKDAERYRWLRKHVTDKQPAPVVDDASMARALEWVRALAKPCSAEEREMLNSVEEAIAAYDPNCGARTVRVVDDAMVERYLTAVHEHLGGLPREQWNRYREDGGATLRRIARIGLTAALTRAQEVQS